MPITSRHFAELDANSRYISDSMRMRGKLTIVDLTPDLVPEIWHVYNEGVAGVPHCYPVSGRWFAEAMEGAQGESDRSAPLRDQRVLVARHGAETVGFIHVARDFQNPDIPTWGIRFLMYRPGERAVGNALIQSAARHFETQSADRILAFHQSYRYGFYHRSAAFLSDRLGHVQALFQTHGYERVSGEVFMDWDDYGLAEREAPPLSIDVAGETSTGRGTLPGLTNRALLDGEEIGECTIVSCGEYADQEAVQDRLFVASLDINEPYQGRRLGVYLLRKTLNDAYEIGYRHAAISTAMDNARAFVFYTNYGFRVSDWTYGWVLRLER